jgi:hypothetical protein
MYLLFCWFDWLLGILAEGCRYTSLSSEVIYNVLSILRKEVFDKSIFDRVERDDCNLASNPETTHRLDKRALDMSELIVDSYSESLEYPRCTLGIKTRIFDDAEELEGGVYLFCLTLITYCPSNEECLLLISISGKYMHQFSLRESHNEIFGCLSCRSVESHIEWSVESDRESPHTIIIVSTRYSEIIEDEVHFTLPEPLKCRIYLLEARMDSDKLILESCLLDILECVTKVISITIEPDKFRCITHVREHHHRMSTESECCIDDESRVFYREKNRLNLTKKYACVCEHEIEKIYERM